MDSLEQNEPCNMSHFCSNPMPNLRTRCFILLFFESANITKKMFVLDTICFYYTVLKFNAKSKLTQYIIVSTHSWTITGDLCMIFKKKLSL